MAVVVSRLDKRIIAVIMNTIAAIDMKTMHSMHCNRFLGQSVAATAILTEAVVVAIMELTM